MTHADRPDRASSSGLTGHFDHRTRDGWLNELVLQLRLRDADGATVGDAIAEVESHLDDSGETPLEAFGDPREYAASLPVRPLSGGALMRQAVSVLGIGATGYIGTTLVLGALFHWGGEATLSGGELIGLLGGAVMALLLLAGAKTIIGRARWGGLAAWYVLAFALAFVPGLFWRAPVLRVPAALALLAGIALLLTMGWLLRRTMGDPVRDPRLTRPGMDDVERALVDAGRPVAAIKAHRERTGVSLREARDAIERRRA